MRKLILFFSLLIVNYSLSIASVRYVSHTGTSTPPYTSWQTAADSIQKCVDYSTAGDTIYVANRVYKEKIIIQDKFLTLIGSSWDSCIVDSRDLEVPTDFRTFYIDGNMNIKGFNILVSYSNKGTGIIINYADTSSIITGNKIDGAKRGIWIFNSSMYFKHNI